MPLPKRVVEPVHVSRNTIPEGYPLPSELEAATNGTLANIVRQLSSLSRHAEDTFGELVREAQGVSIRANNLQARIDRLAMKVTQLDSTVEEVSLQDIHMRKAFKSSVVFDQQVVSRDTMPTAMLETYQACDKPPPLDKLNPFREDGKDGLKFYTDPNYFFDLWRQEMLKDTERMMHDRGKKVSGPGETSRRYPTSPHRPRTEGGGARHKKRVRQPHNTRERQREIAVGHGEYIMPQNIHYRAPHPVENPDEALLSMDKGVVMDPRPPRPNSIELRRNYPEENSGGIYSPRSSYGMGYDHTVYQQQQQQQPIYVSGGKQAMDVDLCDHAPSRNGGPRPNSARPTQPPPAPPSTNNSNTRYVLIFTTPTISSANNTPTRGRSMSAGRDQLPPPPPPPGENVMSPGLNGPIASHVLARQGSGSRSASPQLHQPQAEQPQELPPPPPIPASPPATNIPPPPPPPPPFPAIMTNGTAKTSPLVNGDVGKSPHKQVISTSPPKSSPPKNAEANRKPNQQTPIIDPRNDLLKAIREETFRLFAGIKLRKVEKNEQKEVERVNALHDVASILARRVAVEFSDSDSASESEYDSEGWGEQETSA
ncbi:UNVERIFIED_CONTAM: hypothetical protein PYX00_002638 [Menopon gallinae]|uniref:Wiskott-Aldrich syndrome protein family member n=1 Tax=Menopon gallinae TaxID=328185 RepID=A0AAW2HWX1_9NEOP